MTLSPGRPRTADAEERITTAAIELYGEKGWTALSLASASQWAGLGKSSAYLRWPSKEDLLADAMDRHGAHVEDVDTGDIYTDLVALGMKLFEAFDGPAGRASLRLRIDALIIPELQAIEARIRNTQVAAAREIVRRGIRRGDIPESTPVGLLLHAVCGGIINYVTGVTSQGNEQQHRRETEEFCQRLVGLVLQGLCTGQRD